MASAGQHVICLFLKQNSWELNQQTLDLSAFLHYLSAQFIYFEISSNSKGHAVFIFVKRGLAFTTAENADMTTMEIYVLHVDVCIFKVSWRHESYPLK